MRLEKNKTHLRLSKRKSTLIDQKTDKHTYKKYKYKDVLYTYIWYMKI